VAVGIRVLQFLPESLADRDVDPHGAVEGWVPSFQKRPTWSSDPGP